MTDRVEAFTHANLTHFHDQYGQIGHHRPADPACPCGPVAVDVDEACPGRGVDGPLAASHAGQVSADTQPAQRPAEGDSWWRKRVRCC